MSISKPVSKSKSNSKKPTPKKRKAGEALPSGSVRYRLYLGMVDGKPRYKSFTGPSQAAAKKAALAWQAQQELEEQIRGQPTLAKAMDEFITHRSSVLSPATIRGYRTCEKMLAEHCPDLVATRLCLITAEQVQAEVNRLAKIRTAQGGSLSPKTIANRYGFLTAVLASQGITLTGVRLPAKQIPDLQIPEDAQVKRLMESIRGQPLEVPVLLAVFGPMRRSEICALDVTTDVDFEACEVHVHQAMVPGPDGGYIVKPTPKSAAGNRRIIYPPEVIAKLKGKHMATDMTPDAITMAFARAAKKAGMAGTRFHDLRHYSASLQLELCPEQYVMDRGGWSTSAAMHRYIHALDKQRAAYAAKTNSALKGLGLLE